MIEIRQNDQIPDERLAREYRLATSSDLNRIVTLGNRGYGLGVRNLVTRVTYFLVPLLAPPFSLTVLCGDPVFTGFEQGVITHARIQVVDGLHLFEARNTYRDGGWQSFFRGRDVRSSLYILKG